MREIFQIDLMADSGPRGHDPEIGKGALAPAQEFIALQIAFEFERDVALEGVRAAEGVDADGVVDHQVDRRQWIDLLRIAAQVLERVAHRGEIDHRGNPREVLQQDAGRAEGDLVIGAAAVEPVAECLDVLRRDRAAVLEAQHILEQHLHRKGKPGEIEPQRLARRVDAVIGIFRAAHFQHASRLQIVLTDTRHGSTP